MQVGQDVGRARLDTIGGRVGHVIAELRDSFDRRSNRINRAFHSLDGRVDGVRQHFNGDVNHRGHGLSGALHGALHGVDDRLGGARGGLSISGFGLGGFGLGGFGISGFGLRQERDRGRLHASGARLGETRNGDDGSDGRAGQRRDRVDSVRRKTRSTGGAEAFYIGQSWGAHKCLLVGYRCGSSSAARCWVQVVSRPQGQLLPRRAMPRGRRLRSRVASRNRRSARSMAACWLFLRSARLLGRRWM